MQPGRSVDNPHMRLEPCIEHIAVALRGNQLIVAELLRAQHPRVDRAGSSFLRKADEFRANPKLERAVCLLMRTT